MSSKIKTMNLLQFIFEILVGIGYAVGLIPFGYLISMWWVIPLTIANLIFSLIRKEEVLQKDNTVPFTITNVIMAWLSIIPFLGYLTRITGIVMSVLSLIRVGKDLKTEDI
ncbi:hypothetical protein ACFL0W_03330 [Nanoarchaeota archaeon]